MRHHILPCLVVLTAAAPAWAVSPITCTVPIMASDSIASLKARFGKAATVTMINGAEGERLKALVLFGNDPARRLELIFADTAMRHPATLRWYGTGWVLAGLRVGDGADAVTKANGGPFQLSGFEWDYGGYVNDLKRGKLAKLKDGCRVSIRFAAPDQDSSGRLSGDQDILSTNPLLSRFPPRISELSINWPQGKGK